MKETCLHEVMCYRYRERKYMGDCPDSDICKNYITSVVIRAHDTRPLGSAAVKTQRAKKRGRPIKRKVTQENPQDDLPGSDVSDDTVTLDQYKKARKKLNNAQTHGTLTENQELAIQPMKHMSFSEMSESQRRQLIDISKTVTFRKVKP